MSDDIWITTEPVNSKSWRMSESEFAAALQRAATKPPRLLTLLPLRVRLRLAAVKVIDTIGCWLCDHHRPGMAMWLWRVCGLWRKR